MLCFFWKSQLNKTVAKTVLFPLKVITHWEQGDQTQIGDTNMQMMRQRIFSINTQRDVKLRLKFARCQCVRPHRPKQGLRPLGRLANLLRVRKDLHTQWFQQRLNGVTPVLQDRAATQELVLHVFKENNSETNSFPSQLCPKYPCV